MAFDFDDLESTVYQTFGLPAACQLHFSIEIIKDGVVDPTAKHRPSPIPQGVVVD